MSGGSPSSILLEAFTALSLTGTLHVSHLTVDRLLVDSRCRLGMVPGTDAERPIEGVFFHGQEVDESAGDPYPRV